MEKSVLTEFERRCIQEEPAYCTAACPLHMDVKTFLGHMAEQDMDKAFKAIEKTLPLPEVMARICDHPCEPECIRTRIDAPLAIGDLERICAKSRTKPKKRFLPPQKGKKAGVWGSGLSSLTVAWDLGLKGYGVTVYDKSPALGGLLLTLSHEVLPREILEQELDLLKTFGVSFQVAASSNDAFGGEKGQAFDAVYLGLDSDGEPHTGIAYDDAGIPETDDFSLETSDPKIFAGGFSRDGKGPGPRSYPVAFAAQGRKAAASMDRFMSKVSVTAGREREGVFQTRLSTDISGIAPEPRMALAFESAPNLEKAAKEAKRCIQCDCSRCIRVCAYIEDFKGFPGRYAREIYNNATIVMGEKKANRLINSCSLCDLCQRVCPNDFSMADLCLTARQEMVRDGKMPVSAHEFALQEMRFASGEDCFFARHAPGAKTSDYLFFPGCQLLGSSPSQVEKVYEFLRTQVSAKTGFVSGCCGAPARWAGREDLYHKNIEPFKTFWEASGKPPIIAACTSCTRMLSLSLPGAGIISLYQKMSETADQLPGPVQGKAQGKTQSKPMNILDPCTARDDIPVQKAVRTLAARAGIEVRELPASGTYTECCGFGGLVYNANPPLSKKIIQRRAGQSDHDYLAYCAMCRDRLASTGKRIAHVLDLFWPDSDSPEERRDPGFSRRHDNLAKARLHMLEALWKETAPSKSPPPLDIHMASAVEKILEEDYILKTDIEKVLRQVETGGGHFLNPKTGAEIAYFRPANVCFWIEFKRTGTGYEILNAWRHRMTVVPDTGFVPGTPAEAREDEIVCQACNEKLNDYKNHVEYLGSRFDVALPQCRRCGRVYISPALARGKMAEVEKILEDK
nr:NAD(P)-binding protein [Desulfobacula sp.]